MGFKKLLKRKVRIIERQDDKGVHDGSVCKF